MKMNGLLLGILLFASNNLFAADKEGGNGGDAVVTSDSALRLRDMVDPGNCTWKSGKSIIAQKDLQAVLDKLAEINPSFSYKLREQIVKIRWCYTATLKKINTNDDEETLTYYQDPFSVNKIQAGIRVVNNVYIDRSIIAPNLRDGRMLLEDRPFFYIHEAMHAFLYMKTPNRNKRVRDAVKAIKDFYVGDTNGDDFESMIQGSDLLVSSGENLVVQSLFRILYDSTLSIEKRIEIGSEILSPKDIHDLRPQWNEIKVAFSDAELMELTQKTGLTRFEFFSVARKNLEFEQNSLLGFLYTTPDAFYVNSFGSCRLSLDEREVSSRRIGQIDSDVQVFDLSIPRDRTEYAQQATRETMFWARISNIKTNEVLKKLPRTKVSKSGTKVIYDVSRETQGAQVFESYFLNSLCDFKPSI